MCPGSVSHAKKHFINSTHDHKPDPLAVQDNVVTIDANGLPVQDSGVPISSLVSGLKPMGGWDCSGGAYPVAPDVGDFYWCTVAGEIEGIDYELQDWLVYVASSTWQKIDNTESGITMRPDILLAGEVPDISDAGFVSWIAGSRGIAIGNTTKRAFLCWLIVIPGIPPTRELQFVALDNAIWKSDINSGNEVPDYSTLAFLDVNNSKAFVECATRKFLSTRFDDNLYWAELSEYGVKETTIVLGWQNDPPVPIPTEGDIYVVGNIPTGAWIGHRGEFAVWVNGAWTFIMPRVGFIVVDATNSLFWYCRTFTLGVPQWSGMETAMSHINLLDTNWASAGHTIDTDINLDKNRLLFSTITKNWAMGIAENILGTPPVSPVNDGFYLVHAPVSGAFIGHAGQVAHYTTVGGWTFRTPDAIETWSTKATANLYITWGSSGWTLLWTLVNHNNLQGVTKSSHHQSVEAYNQAGTLLTDDQKVVRHKYNYTNGGNTINLVALTDASVEPSITFGIKSALTYDSRQHFTPIITSLTHNGTYWVAVIRCNKIYYGTGPPGFYFTECATNDVQINMIAEGE